MKEKEIESIIKLGPEARYRYFVVRVADADELWSLANEQGWVLSGDFSGREHVPVWSHSVYAERCAVGAWEGTVPKRISLEQWLERWVPGMIRDSRLIAVFPTPNHSGLSVEPKRVELDIKKELEMIE